MDRNSIIGYSLIVAIFVGWYFWMTPSEEERAQQQRRRDSLERVRQEEQLKNKVQKPQQAIKENQPAEQLSDSLQTVANQNKFGVFANVAQGENEIITLENQLLKIQLSSQGAKPLKVELKDYSRHDSSQLVLFNEMKNELGLNFFANNRAISTNDLYFKLIESGKTFDASQKAQRLVFRLTIESGKYIDYEYTLLPDSYLLGFRISFVGMESIVDARRSPLELRWNVKGNALERGDKWEKDNSSIYYKFFGDDVDDLGNAKDDAREVLNTRVKWISYKQQFFSSVLIADNYIDEAVVAYKRSPENDSKHVLDFSSELSVSVDDQGSIPFHFYFGPNKFSVLKDIQVKEKEDLELERMIPYFGWGIGIINRYAIIPLFSFLSSLEFSMGIIILLMTIIIKLVLFPFTYKSYVSMAEMRALKPEIDKINEKIPQEKAMERQQATMALYRKAGVSPMGGCLPMLLQFPILIAMFRFFPASIELRQQSFLWASDLSTYDVLFNLPFGLNIPFYGAHVSGFTLLMTLSSVLTMKFSNQQMSSSNQMPGMQTMMYMMPIMFMVMFNSYSAGLSYYYFLSNIITFGQTMLIRRFTNEEKILARLEENKKKPKKKSKFQTRLEEMAKQQQAKRK